MLNPNSLVLLINMALYSLMMNNKPAMTNWCVEFFFEPKYVDIGLLQSLHLWDDMSSLFGVLGWTCNFRFMRNLFENLLVPLSLMRTGNTIIVLAIFVSDWVI